MSLTAGDALLLPGDGHLWIVVSDPGAAAEVFLVNLTTHAPGGDDSCVVESGEHPWVKHRSRVRYRNPTLRLQDVERRLADGSIRRQEPVSARLLGRIREGARRTQMLTHGA